MIRRLLLVIALLLAPAVAAQENLAVQTARLNDLRSIREIKNLQAMWGHQALAGDWSAMAALATDDVVMVLPVPVVGRAALERSLVERQGHGEYGMSAGRLNIRLYISPVITLASDGQSATGRWHHIAMTGEASVAAGWIGTTDVIQYRLTDQGWRIAHIRPYLHFSGDYATGWSHDAATLERAPYHYTPDEAGMLLPNRQVASPMSSEAISEHASRLLAESHALNTVAAFGYYLDRRMYDDIVDLFSDDARITIEGQGTWTGRDGVRRYLARYGTAGLNHGELNDILQLMPQVSSDGVLTVRNVELGMIGEHGGEGTWSAGSQTFDLVREADGKLRIALLWRRPLMRADYVTGWSGVLEDELPWGSGGEPDQSWGNGEIGSSATRPPLFMTRHYPSARTAIPIVPNALAMAEAFDAAENVSNAYGYYIDQFSWANTSALFARDGWKELSYIGTFIGRDRVGSSMVQRYGDGGPNDAFQAIHQKTQPYVTVSDDGQRAQIRTRLLQMNSSSTGPGSWIGGIYENQVVKEDGIWRIHGMDLDYVWLADYGVGWMGADAASSARFGLSDEAIAAFAPDAPLRGEAFAPFPRIAPMGFHFANPVSGREPPLRLHWSDGHRD